MDEDARRAKNAYQKAWREKNKDRVKAINARYWKNRAAREAGERKDSGVEDPAAVQ